MEALKQWLSIRATAESFCWTKDRLKANGRRDSKHREMPMKMKNNSKILHVD
jgi:hypothetical protein